MSYILDALKKIEREKNRKTYPDGRARISGDLFQERVPPAAKAGAWKIVAVVAAASLLTFAGTWLVLHGNGKKSSAGVPPSPASVNPPPVTQSVPVSVMPQSQPVAVPPLIQSAVDTVPAKNAESVGGEDSPARNARRSQREVKAQPAAQKPSVPTVQAPADIKLSGIAWQEERSGRRAVINGFLLKEGAVVSGAKITEIQAGRVRFLTTSGQFELKLDSVLPAEVKK